MRAQDKRDRKPRDGPATDVRLPAHKNMRLPAVALFRDWLGEHGEDATNYDKEAGRMRLSGDQFRIGTARPTGDDKFAFIIGQSGADCRRAFAKTMRLAHAVG